MNILLYTNNSEDNKLVKDLTLLATFTGELKEATDVLNPVITLTGIDEHIYKLNYVFIPELGRYYFVTDIESVNNNLWALTLHVDVLMSYQTDILNLSGILARQEYNYNMELRDTNIPTLQKTNIQYMKFPNTFSKYRIVMPILGN